MLLFLDIRFVLRTEGCLRRIYKLIQFSDMDTIMMTIKIEKKRLRENHGSSKTRLYKKWKSMRRRCKNKNETLYKNYGGRGISITKDWDDSFISFRDWAIENGYSDGLSIERIDNDGNYSPENCRWLEPKDQANNTRKNVFVVAFGEKKSIARWSIDKRCKVDYGTLRYRIKAGWTVEIAISTPVDGRRDKLPFGSYMAFGEIKS